ncbi:MAG TPA: glycosyltransferase family 39 protein, partial [Bacteroidia bacterium]|nr:glycosyltransferase family 39 protein [Bacteroidia bacterium]
MANKKPVQKPISAKAKVTSRALGTAPVIPVFPFSFNIKLIILAVLGFVLYANTLRDEYCLDDGIVIEKNQYVQHGFDGIGKIMTTDAYDSYYKEMNAGQQLSGGRYRPLSEVIFAIEHAVFGETTDHSIAMQRHLFSIISYMLCILAIFFFLSKYLLAKFKYGEDMAFFASVLFAIHPLHTEVVANVKSLDEILSILFITLTFIFSLRYIDTKKLPYMIIGVVCFFLSLLAKEYAITLIVLLPIVFYLLRTKKVLQIFIFTLPYLGVLLIYMKLRYNAVGFNGHIATNEILDNPYLLATHTQKIATEIFVLGKYLWMLIVPYPLLSDYSYDMIPYHNFTDISVLFTILLYIGLGVWCLWLLYKRNVLAFAVLFYLFCLSLVSNLIMDIGATMGERLIFHSSLGFVILLSYGVFELIKKWDLQMKRNVIFGLTSLLVIVCGYET